MVFLDSQHHVFAYPPVDNGPIVFLIQLLYFVTHKFVHPAAV